jgi:hypothetical protein
VNVAVMLAIAVAILVLIAALEWLNRSTRAVPLELPLRALYRRPPSRSVPRTNDLAHLEALALAAATGHRTACRRLVERLAAQGVEVPAAPGGRPPGWAEICAAASQLAAPG